MAASMSIRDPAAGARLADALAVKHMRNEELARKAGVSLKSIRRWLKGGRITAGNAYAVAKALEVPVWDIWPDLGPSNTPTLGLAVDDGEAEPALSVADHGILDAFVSRSELMRAYPPAEMLAEATRVQVMGLSLNQVVQSVSDRQLRAALDGGLELQCLFLQPYSRYITDRESEEGHAAGVLSQLTATNIDTLKRARRHLPAETADRLQLRTYDAPLRFHVMVVDDSLALVQLYLPTARGTESPALVLRPTTTPPDLFTEFATVFTDSWATGNEA